MKFIKMENMSNLFDAFYGLYAFLTIFLTVYLSVRLVQYPPAVLMLIIAQCAVILVPYSAIWLYFRKRLYKG